MANAADISFRSPKSSIAVLPVFRQDATPIPDYFLDKTLPQLEGAQIKIALAIFRLMHLSGNDEIITNSVQLSHMAFTSTNYVRRTLSSFSENNIFKINNLGRPSKKGIIGDVPFLIQIKYINRVNYTSSH